MRSKLILVLALVFALPLSLFAGDPVTTTTDVIIPQNDFTSSQLSAYYDLRDRKSYVQVTNTSGSAVPIHIQVFQHDRACSELNFNDELTGNDTVVYDLDNIIRNNGTEVPINLQDDSYGYVVVTVDGSSQRVLIGNFRIVDDAGYEYRTNMAASQALLSNLSDIKLIANFNTIAGANQADLVGYVFDGFNSSTVTNVSTGINFDIFVFDMDEEPLSCDRKNFACGAVMNYGINEDYPNSKGDNVICSGGGLANPSGGFVSFENGALGTAVEEPSDLVFANFIGINNGNGTGSMDTWIDPGITPCGDDGICTIFQSTQTTDGNIGGVQAADAICQQEANDAGFSGTFLAWISDSLGNSPDTRFRRNNLPYVEPDDGGDQIIATSYADLTDGAIPFDMNSDAMGADNNRFHWTGTNGDGTSSGVNCNNWTSNSDTDNGTRGDENDNAGGLWTNQNDEPCDNANLHIVCVEQ